jgi:hypothetical protein
VGYVWEKLHERTRHLTADLEMVQELAESDWELPSVDEWIKAEDEFRSGEWVMSRLRAGSRRCLDRTTGPSR